MTDTKPWTLPQLLNRMLSAGWQPYPEAGKWSHPDGAVIDLNADDVSKRPYWHQLAERNVLPPTSPVPENWGKKVTS